MEDPRSSRRPAKPAYGDVFAGPPKHSGAFAANSDDYAEIFGGGAAACSIPFLDLPPAAGSAGGGGGRVDYKEIFGGFTAGDFAVDYEELVDAKRRAAEGSAASNGRVCEDAKFGKRAEVSGRLPEGTSKTYGTSSEKNTLSAISNLSDDGSRKIDILHQRTMHGSINDVISGKTHITELHPVTGYANIINPCSSQDRRTNSANNQVNNFATNISYSGQLNDFQLEEVAATSTSNTKNYGVDLRPNVSDDDAENVKQHSRSSSNQSASSGDIHYADSTYVGISEINLRTRPSRVPPPSRAPPKIAMRPDTTKNRQIHYSVGASKSRGHPGAAKDSSRFLDVEVDAAASAAAMKEAMEQAEARLRSAKELMERKLDTRKKLAHKEGAKYGDRKEVTASDLQEIFGDVSSKKSLPKEDIGAKKYALNGTHKVSRVGRCSPEHEEQEAYVVVAEDGGQANRHESSKMHSKSVELSGEWKTQDQFYELINNEKKFRASKEAPKLADVDKKAETMEFYFEKPEPVNEFKTTMNVNEVNSTIGSDEAVDDPKVCDVTGKKEIKKTLDETPEPCISDEPDDSSSSYLQNAYRKLHKVAALLKRPEAKKPDAPSEVSCKENEVNLKSFSNSVGFQEIYHDDKVDSKHARETSECRDTEELTPNNVATVSHETEGNLKTFGRNVIQHENENDLKVACGTHATSAEEELASCEEAHLYEKADCIGGNGQQESSDDGNDHNLEGISSVEESNEVLGSCLSGENGLETETDQEGAKLKEKFEETQPATDTIGLESNEDRTNLAAKTDYGQAEPREGDGVSSLSSSEALPKLQRNEIEQNYDGTPLVTESSVGIVLGGDHEEFENSKLEQGNGIQSAPDTDTIYVQTCFSGQSKNVGDSTKTEASVANEEAVGGHKGGKMDGEKSTESQTCYEKEQARKLEEEKARERDREREREKDRLSVERATREAHEPALAESRERAERIAVERVTAEARQRALAEAQGKAEKASADALEKALLEKALKEAKLRAERAAVERATAEARERAVEKALAERAAADARQRAERLNTMPRDKNMKENDKEDREIKLKSSSSDVLRDVKLKSNVVSDSSQRDSPAQGEVESPLRCKARLERHQRTVERAAKALAEKNMRDILAQREQAERNRLAEALDADVKRWSTGKEGNLRALLSTLQYILGPESGWQPVPLTDVITAAAVKKAYRKATLCVHPDKLQQRGASIQQKYICEKVFDLLKDAWNRFNSVER